MAHELTSTNGQTEMAFVGQTPWHGLGQRLERGASIDDWAVQAGMSWAIQRSKVRYATGKAVKDFNEWPDFNVLFRSDTKAPLGMVSDKYKVVQPKEVLEFFRDLVTEQGFQLETAGTLFGGRRFWALAAVGESAIIANPKDVVGGYLLLNTSADGSKATSARFTSVRVVCNNTLSMALSGKAKREVSVSHRSKFSAASVKAELGIAHQTFEAFVKAMQELARVKVTPLRAEELTVKLLLKEGGDPKLIKSGSGFQNIMSLFHGKGKGATMEGVRGTGWGWVNAVTEHIDFHRKTDTPDHRLATAWFGWGDDMKTRAVELVTA